MKTPNKFDWRHFFRGHVLGTFRVSAQNSKKSRSEVSNVRREFWSGRPGSNRRRPAWEAGILPLNYARVFALEIMLATSREINRAQRTDHRSLSTPHKPLSRTGGDQCAVAREYIAGRQPAGADELVSVHVEEQPVVGPHRT